MDDKLWQKLYDNVSPVSKTPTIVGFNVNLDRIMSVTPALLSSAFFNQPALSELRSRLDHSMRTCTAEEWFVTDPQMYQQFTCIFSDSGHLTIGGQAGIAAVHLASIGISEVLCIADSPGPVTIKILEDAGVHLLDLNKGYRDSSDTIHLIFEYTRGLVPVDDGVIPRNNRFIVSPLHSPESFLLTGNKKDEFRSRISRYPRAFISGYQYLQTDEEFRSAADQCLLMKKNNHRMRIHVECVSVTADTVIRGFFNHILPVVDSIGLNEHELILLLECLDSPVVKQEFFEKKMSPLQQVKGALEICSKSGLKRLHLHTFGYYVLVIRNDCAHPETSLNALLFASQTVARAALGTHTEISPFGLFAINDVAESFGPPISPGIFQIATHTIVMIPTIIVKDISKSTGLGDILSSSAFVADLF
ncbi:MAG: ADP-dependent glucokinase/phosphofructokinase [Methanoregula sp.]|nr:ADP-dependent glucokinase/phosphofructokinase [Methanoregula sp.]